MNERSRTHRVVKPAGVRSPKLTSLLALGCLVLAVSCLQRRDEGPDESSETRCASCHGDPARAGDYLQRAAPPLDLSGASGTAYPGVGAHSIHLNAGPTHGAIACNECHVVPARVDSPGHADSAGPAPITFGLLAKTGGRTPSYDPIARTCSGSWCHRDHADAVWTEPRSSSGACGSCHGLPPPLPHPQSTRCEACHAQVIDADRHFINPALHVDGVVEESPGSCESCHGSGDNPAPPPDTLGGMLSTAVGVGAHRAHLAGGAFSRPLACAECHTVPESADDAGHIEGRPARVTLTGVATTGAHVATWDPASGTCSDTWCHGPKVSQPSPSWTAGASLGCTSCHGAPPPAPHPQLSNCSHCHAAVVAADNVTIIDRTRHVDGIVDVSFDQRCNSCHGSANAAPPIDLSGHSATTFPGVGAHQAHLAAGARSRTVLCSDCHEVPVNPLDPGHIDSPPPARVLFSGPASAFGGTPTYEQGICSNTSCHGGKFPGDHRSGGSNVSPQWTKVDGTQAACGSCHSLPPPPPHPYQTDCSSCHQDIGPDNVSFIHPELHVDGVVTFTVP